MSKSDERYPPSDWEYIWPDGSTVVETLMDRLDHRDYFRKHNAVASRPAPHKER